MAERTWGGTSTLPTGTLGEQQQNLATSGQESSSAQKQGTSSQVQNQTQAVNIANMPAQSLAALQALIAQLSDRNAVSSDAAGLMLAQKGINRPRTVVADRVMAGPDSRPMGSGIMYYDERGMPTDQAGYTQAVARYAQQLNELQAAGGIVPGGTAESRAAAQERLKELATIRNARAGYTKADAFADAAALNDKAMRQMLEQILPSINASIEASGTSGGAVGALLKQDAAARAAENAASLGLDAAVKYGGITNDMNRTIAGLLENDTPVLDSLLQALNVSKGSVQQGGQSSSTSTSSSTSETTATSGTRRGSQTGTSLNAQIQSRMNPLDQVLAGLRPKTRADSLTDIGGN